MAVVVVGVSLPASAATPLSGGGGAGGGVQGGGEPPTTAEFLLGIDGEHISVELTWFADGAATCTASTSTDDDGVTAVDQGGSLIVIIDRVLAGTGVGCSDNVQHAELTVAYANASLRFSSTPLEGGCRQVLQNNDAAVATVLLETDGGVVVDGTGDAGSAGFSRELIVCPPGRSAP